MKPTGNILQVQPIWCREQLCVKENLNWYMSPDPNVKSRMERVLFLDPMPVYNRAALHINPYSRYSSVSITKLFPKPNGKICSCGCEAALSPGRSRWANDNCSFFASDVWAIIVGRMPVIDRYLKIYYGRGCDECGANDYEIDHKHPVKFGGAGGWLSNYKKLCKACHRKKTNKDFGWKEKNITTSQIHLPLC